VSLRNHLLAAALCAPLLLSACGGSDPAPEDPTADTPPSVDAPDDVETVPVRLFFPGGPLLYEELRELPRIESAEERINALVGQLLAGPTREGLRAPLGDGITVRRSYLLADGVAAIDLSSPDGAPPPASGSQRELLTVMSLVNTVVLNEPEVNAVVLLWNGRQPTTFAGHLDIGRPLRPDLELVAEGLE
jgi:hypothetical protein